MLNGGLMPHRPYLVVGPAGTGKTTLALQFLCEGARRGERVLFVTLEEPPNEMRVNHRQAGPDLAKVDVFDAIPDVMRYERVPFKDIASVRAAVPFARVEPEIRHTPELTSVEVTITALEQMLRSEVLHRGYTRIVIDSLTALQYFCMKGFDPVGGAQTFLRFLSDLHVTTLLTVEAPLEDVETPERMLARGEIRLFRWELDGVTVRAVGVEKFRGSAHDIRLHPYRIGGRGLDVNLNVTISRDSRLVIEAPPTVAPVIEPGLVESPTTVELLGEEVRDLLLIGGRVDTIRLEVEAALAACQGGDADEAKVHLLKAFATGATPPEADETPETQLVGPASVAFERIRTRADSSRTGMPSGRMPELPIMVSQLGKIMAMLAGPAPPAPGPSPPLRRAAASAAPTPAAPAPVAAPTPPAASPPRPASTPAPTVAPTPSPSPASPAVPATVPMEAKVAVTPPARPPTAVTRPPPPVPAPKAKLPQPPPPPTTAPKAAAPVPTPPPSSAATKPAGPPPLPSPARLPERPAPPPAPLTPFVPPASAPPEPTPVAPEPADTTAPAAIEAVATAAPARKRKRVAAPRKKAAAPVPPPAPAPEATEPPVPSVEPAVSAPEPAVAAPVADTAPPAGEPTPAAAPKPKRRVVRKKKAPVVLAATPGPPPSPESGPKAAPDPPGAAPPPESPGGAT
jgi:KaiC/GvpD/RAD55 family RecA-like ATPase